ncbi:MAG: hypothetical protein WC159_09135 [Sphaerochaetaceae bacterium]
MDGTIPWLVFLRLKAGLQGVGIVHEAKSQLLPGYQTCCREEAGKAGFLVMDLFSDRFKTDRMLDEKVRSFIRGRYAFIPSWSFHCIDTAAIPFMP